MSPEDQKLWEGEEMTKPIDLDRARIKIDPAPFQLVEKTSLLKVHSLFSMIGINHAYVTKIGKLVGVVALKEVCVQFIGFSPILSLFFRSLIKWNMSFDFFLQLREAIENVNSGNLTCNQSTQTTPAAEKPPLEPHEVPLLSNDSEKCNQNTVDSMDSALSNSDNCSDVELGNPVDSGQKTEPK